MTRFLYMNVKKIKSRSAYIAMYTKRLHYKYL